MPVPEIDVPDLNVWLALLDPDHEHHTRARRYWEHEASSDMAFCRVTMLGLFRLLTNSRVMRGVPFTPVEAWDAYHTFAALPEVCFIEDSLATERQFELWSRRPDFPVHSWSNAWIAALASSSGARVVSFDSDFTAFSPLRFLHLRP
jgi:toxin-antitoxin system PIN domain toxin